MTGHLVIALNNGNVETFLLQETAHYEKAGWVYSIKPTHLEITQVGRTIYYPYTSILTWAVSEDIPKAPYTESATCAHGKTGEHATCSLPICTQPHHNCPGPVPQGGTTEQEQQQ